MNTVFFGVKSSERAYLEAHAEATLLDYCLDSAHIPVDTSAEVISVFTGCKVTKEVIEKFSNLRLIACRSTGYDNIDLEECKKRNIAVCNVPSYGEHTVAEFTFALMLALSRKIADCVARVKSTRDFSKDGLTGFDLRGKTLGVIGTGKIGQQVIKIAKGFDMQVVAYDAFPRQELEKELGFSYDSLDAVLGASDILTLHVPAVQETHHMINAEALAKMKSDSYIINTSRGVVIDTPALIDALRSGRLAGAALDVLEEESSVDPELLKVPNLFITPHNAFDTKEAIERILKTTLQNISAFQNATPQNIVL